MDFPIFFFGIRNVLLVQLLILIMVPEYAVHIRQEMIRIWRSINAPFLQRIKARKKGSSFWEIDMTKFEP